MNPRSMRPRKCIRDRENGFSAGAVEICILLYHLICSKILEPDMAQGTLPGTAYHWLAEPQMFHLTPLPDTVRRPVAGAPNTLHLAPAV